MDAKLEKQGWPDLRRRSEAQLASLAVVSPAQGETDPQKLVHELRVQHIALEMQHEELRESRVQLELQKENYRDFYDFSPTGLVSLDSGGAIVEINLAGANLLKTARSQLTGEPFASHLVATDRLRFEAGLKQLFLTEDPQKWELQGFPCNGGPLRTAQMTASLSRDGQLCLAVLVDITERKFLELELRKSEIRFRTMVDYTYDWEYWLGSQQEIIYMNPSCERITGYGGSSAGRRRVRPF